MGTMEDTVILNSQDIVQAQRATSAVLGVVLAERDLATAHHVLAEITRRADGWMLLWSATRPTEPTR
jgi:hypothetical protein